MPICPTCNGAYLDGETHTCPPESPVGFPVALVGHAAFASFLGLLGIAAGTPTAGRGAWLFLAVVGPGGLAGYVVGRLDFGMHPRAAAWAWIPAFLLFQFVVIFVLGMSSPQDRLWNQFIGNGFCGDGWCVLQYVVTAPMMGSASYSAAARIGRKLRPQ